MTKDVETKMSEQYQTFLGPVIKANKLAAADLETLANFQMSTLQAYVGIAINRMKAAAEIRDAASLKSFMTSQSEAIASLQQKVVDDARTLSDLAAGFKAEFNDLMQESLSVVVQESKSVIQEGKSVMQEGKSVMHESESKLAPKK
jgi:phasin family protein